MKAALITPYLPHLPYHPSYMMGYGAANLVGRFDLDVIDLNAELHFKNRKQLKSSLDLMDKAQIVSDAENLHLFHNEIETYVARYYAAIAWRNYCRVYITPPSWFPMVEAEDVLRLSRAIKQASPETKILCRNVQNLA